MARVETIVVGGGINAGTPFTVKAIPYISNTDPAFLQASPILFQVTGASPAIVLSPTGADPEASATSLLRVVGGIASFPNAGAGTLKHLILGARQSLAAVLATTQDSTLIGNDIAITSLGSGSTLVGKGITSATTARITVIGDANTIGSAWTGDLIVIGASNAIGNTGGASPGDCIFIGSGITVTTGGSAMSQCTIIGIGATISSGGGSSCTAVGALNALNTSTQMSILGRNNSVGAGITRSCVLGVNNTVSHNDCVILGGGLTTTAAGQCWIGGPTIGSIGITTVIIGKGDTAGPPSAVTIRLTNSTNNDTAAGALTLQAGLSTGNAVSPAVQLNVGVVTASGGALQASRTGVACSHTAVATETYLMLYDVDNATLERVTVGAADSGGVGFKVLRIPN